METTVDVVVDWTKSEVALLVDDGIGVAVEGVSKISN